MYTENNVPPQQTCICTGTVPYQPTIYIVIGSANVDCFCCLLKLCEYLSLANSKFHDILCLNTVHFHATHVYC